MSPATALFVARARAVRPDFTPTTDTAPIVANICRRLDGLPLAIELAAARMRFLAPSALLDQLDHRLALLTGGPRDFPARHQALRAAIDWSYGLLAEPERQLFARLGVFAGGCTTEAAAAVGADTGEPAWVVLARLETLVDQSLLQASEDATGATRLVMLETIREYALEQLEKSGEVTAVRGLHAAHYLAVWQSAELELFGPTQGTWLARLEVEHDNLRAALAWALARRDAPLALQLSGAAVQFWWAHGHRAEAPRWLAAAPRCVDDPIDASIGATQFHSAARLSKLRPAANLRAAIEKRRALFAEGRADHLSNCVKYEMRTHLVDLLIRQDKMMMAHGVENRVPFLDRRVIEFARALPAGHLAGPSSPTGAPGTKSVVKELARRTFDAAFVDRRKSAFNLPLAQYFRSDRFVALMEERLLPGMAARGLVDVAVVRRWWRRALSAPSTTEAFWIPVALELWAQQFIDRRGQPR
jgi:hypothetical protein